jgi:hypothetical protein
MNNIKKRSISGWLILLSLGLVACSNEVDTLLPGPADAAVNFYNASEVLGAVDSLRINNYVFIDDSTKPYPPKFDWYYSDRREYPLPIGVGSSSGSYKVTDYMRISAGSHRVMFTGREATGLLSDTTIDFKHPSFNCLYLVESTANDSAYRLVVVPEDRKSPAAGKVGIRIINLCPDIDALNSSRLDRNSNIITTDMPQNILSGTFTSYLEIDTASSISNRLFVSFFTGSDKENALITAAVPATVGHTFALVVQGFSHDVKRRIAVRRNGDGSLFYDNVNVMNNLRVNVRATY